MPLPSANAPNAESKHFPGLLYARDAASWPDRRRGISNFLTQSFILAEVLAAELFIGKAARAADDLDPAEKLDSDAAPPVDAAAPLGDVDQTPEPAPGAQEGLLDAASSELSPIPRESAAAPSLTGLEANSLAGAGLGGGGAGGASAGTAFGAPHAGSASLPSDAASSAVGEGVIEVAAPISVGGGVTDAAASIPFGEGAIHGRSLSGNLGSDTRLIHEGGDLGDLLRDLDPELAADFGLELQLFDFTGSIEGSLTPLNIGLDLQTPAVDLSLDGGVLAGLDLHVGVEALGAQTIIGVVAQLSDATGLNLLGEFEAPDVSGVSSLGQIATPAPISLGEDVAAAAVAPLSHEAVASSGESIAFFGSEQAEAPADGLFVDGRYTDYNLALQAEAEQSDDAAVIERAATAEADADVHGSADTPVESEQLLDHSLADQDLLRGQSI